MTSGTFKSVPIDEIWVNREKRQRRDLLNIEELAQSIAAIGLIHPPVIRRSGELVVGERRWTACKSLGWTAIPIQFIEDLPDHEIKKVELEENVRRVDIPWPDQCKAVAEYHAIRSAEAGWTVAKTGEALGYTIGAVSQKLAVAKELEAGNAKVVAAPKFSTARNIVARQTERRKSIEMEAVTPAPVDAPILTESFNDWQPNYAGPKFNLIHCDFPYGVNADKHDQGAAASHGGYTDSLDVYMELFRTLAAGMDNVVDNSAHLMFWFSMDYYDFTLKTLRDMGWKVDPFPLIWSKSDGTGILPDPNRGPRRTYETAFFAHRGDRKVVQAVNNSVALPVTKEFHMSEKPKAVLRHFFRMICDEYTKILDPTCGGGNALVVARELKAHNCLGLERDSEFADRARYNWRQAV